MGLSFNYLYTCYKQFSDILCISLMMWLLISLCFIFGFNYVQGKSLFIIISDCLLYQDNQNPAGDCTEGCKEPTLFYNDLNNCKPIFNSPSDCCPTRYNCSNTQDFNDKKCRFRGKIYNIGDSLDDDEIYGNCKADCLCTEGYDGRCVI